MNKCPEGRSPESKKKTKHNGFPKLEVIMLSVNILRLNRRLRLISTSMTLLFMLLLFQSQKVTSLSSLRCPQPDTYKEKIRPSQMTPLEINVTFLTSNSSGGKGKDIAGAFFIAIDELNNKTSEKGIPVNFSTGYYNDIEQDEVKALQKMRDIYIMGYNTAFVGPDIFCRSAGFFTRVLDIPFFAFDCMDTHNTTKDFLMVNTNPSIAHASIYIMQIFKHFKWTSFFLIKGNFVKWDYAAEELKEQARKKNISLNGVVSMDLNDEYGGYYSTKREYQKLVSSSKDKTRVYVYMGNSESLLEFLRELHKQGITQAGKHVVIAVDDSKDLIDDKFYLFFNEQKNQNFQESKDRHEIESFRNVLLIRPHINFTDTKRFEEKVKLRNHKPPINFPEFPKGFEHIVGTGVTLKMRLHKSAFPLYDATRIYGETVIALMGLKGADPTNATQVICYIRNKRNYTSIVGDDIAILDNGECRSSYRVWSITVKDGKAQKDLKVMGICRDNECNVYDAIDWIKGPPRSEPECGFNNEHCPPSKIQAIFIFLGVFLPLIVIAGIFFGCRHFMYERKLERLAWKINRDDIQRMNDSQFSAMLSPTKTRKKSSIQVNNQLTELLSSPDGDLDPQPEAATGTEDSIELGMYKGSKIIIKQLTRKQLEITRPLKKQLQVRKEMSHENINRFIGACIETPLVLLVSLYCPRKSLKDILENEDSHLDDMFTTSLVQDLIRGMIYIHDSDLCCHGNLKSSNCLVDSRWTLKISDFGFSTLGPPPRTTSHDEKAFKKFLWTAPELIYRRFNSSTSNSSTSQHHYQQFPTHNSRVCNGSTGSHHISAHHQGTQRGDVYSFALVLYELYGRSGPWGNTQLTAKEIIDRLITSAGNPFRPDISILSCDDNIKSLIELCWAEDSEMRPDFKSTIGPKYKPTEHRYLESNIIDNMLTKMEKHAQNLEAAVAERTNELRKEKKMTENLLLRMLPRSVAEILIKGQPVKPEQFECVTIYFSDIVGFTELSAESTPMEVVDFLNELYTLFDSVIGMFDVYKVETIGDAYMVVSGLPNTNGDCHAGEIASMSLMLLADIQQKLFKVRGSTESVVKIRIGIHSGPCCAGVVGLKMPRYCLFGDTVNTANRMESSGEAFKIHCSVQCKQILDKLGGYHLVERGYTNLKGKGQLLTYFLLSENKQQRQNRIAQYTRGERCVSASNLDYNNSFNNNRRRVSGSVKSRPVSATSSSISLPQQLQQHSPQLRTSFNDKNNPVPYSLNASVDSTWSDLPDDPTLLHHSDNNRSISLPRSSSLRQSAPQNMSPIAEDPWSPVHPPEWNQRHSRTSQPVSDRDSLISCHTLTSSGKLPSRRSSEVKAAPDLSGSLEERTRLMHPETIL